jgi:hypothetical protein
MLKGQNLIYFGPEKWDGLWRNRHHLMSRFSEFNKVLYVEPKRGFRKIVQQLTKNDFKKKLIWQEIKQPRITKERENLFIYHSPIYIPIIGRFPFNRIAEFLWNRLLTINLLKLDFTDPIIWLSKPYMLNYMNQFNEKLVVYHIVDEYLSYGGLTEEMRFNLDKLEKKAIATAHVVIVVSRELYRNKKRYNKNTYIVPNATDYKAYARVIESESLLPEDVSTLPRPIIGYSGLISPRLNFELINHLAQVKPQWSIVLIGQINAVDGIGEFLNLKNLSNVHLLGIKPIFSMPKYVKAFDVGMIPYEENENSKNISPLKLYDYLAAGKPIVTTDFATAHEFKDLVKIASTKEEFVINIEDALKSDSQELYIKRRNLASKNRWEVRVNQISDIILSHLN